MTVAEGMAWFDCSFWGSNLAHTSDISTLVPVLPVLQAIGNHEFDKFGELKTYFDKLDYPVLAANIKFREWHGLKDKISSYVVKQVKGRKVGACRAAA